MDIKISNAKNIKSDFILDLPTDKNQPTHTELKVIDSLFGKDSKVNKDNKENYEVNSSKKSYTEFLKYSILIFLVMIMCNIPDEKLPVLPFIGNYDFAPLLMKGIILAGVFYLIETKILTNL